MTTNDVEFKALDDIPEDADKLAGDEVDTEVDLELNAPTPENGDLDD